MPCACACGFCAQLQRCCTVPGPDFSCVHLRCYLLQIAFETTVGAIDIRTAIRPPLLPPMANPEFKTMSVSSKARVICNHVALNGVHTCQIDKLATLFMLSHTA